MQAARHFTSTTSVKSKQYLQILIHPLHRLYFHSVEKKHSTARKQTTETGKPLFTREEIKRFRGERQEADYGDFIRDRLRHTHIQRWLLLCRPAVGGDDFAHGEEDVGSAEYVFPPLTIVALECLCKGFFLVASRLCFMMHFASVVLVGENGLEFEEVLVENEEERHRSAEIHVVSLYFSWKLAL